MRHLSNLVSILLHPLLMPTYGLMLAFNYTYLIIYPTNIKLFVIAMILGLTAIFPAILIGVMIRLGIASDAELSNRKERVIPYLLLLVSLLGCLFYLHKMLMPIWIVTMFLGCATALLGAMIINFWWKISAHMIGIGGLLGGVMSICYLYMMNLWPLFAWLILAAGFVGMARIYLRRHTPMQVYMGFLLGFCSTFLFVLLPYFLT